MAQQTPMMRQWESIKSQHPGTILLFRMGDFYEMFGEDAEVVARECELTLTARDKKNENAVKMCGVPYHAIERYLAQLVGKGYRCAICDQVEDPKYARGLVKREVVRVLSPGTVIEDALLQSIGAAKGNNYLAAISADDKLQTFGLAFLDLSTGEFLAGEVVADLSKNQKAACEPASSLQPLLTKLPKPPTQPHRVGRNCAKKSRALHHPKSLCRKSCANAPDF